jgi:hypothetical protein
MTRFRDPATHATALTGAVLAVCPSCGGCVRVVPHGEARRAACPACTWTREAGPGTATYGDATDPFLGLPLWLRTPLGEHVLWAYDAEHLDLLTAYFAASLRERAPRDGRASSMLETLPRWLKTARPDDVRAALDRLRARLAEAG